MKKILDFKGRFLTPGVVEGEAMVTKAPFSAGNPDPQTGIVKDQHHEWQGQNVKGKVLVFPYGKGSTQGITGIIRVMKRGNAPAAIINMEADVALTASLILAEEVYGKKLPLIDQPTINPVDVIKTGDWIKIDSNKGIIEVFRQ